MKGQEEKFGLSGPDPGPGTEHARKGEGRKGEVSDTRKEELQKISYQLAIYEQQARVVESQINELQNMINSLTLTVDGLKNLKKNREALYNLGSSVFVLGKVLDDEKVFVDVGSGVLVEMASSEALIRITKQLEDLRNEYGKKAQLLTEIAGNLERLNKRGRELFGEPEQTKPR